MLTHYSEASVTGEARFQIVLLFCFHKGTVNSRFLELASFSGFLVSLTTRLLYRDPGCIYGLSAVSCEKSREIDCFRKVLIYNFTLSPFSSWSVTCEVEYE